MIILEDSTGQRMEVKEGQRYNGKVWHVVDSKPPFQNIEPLLNEAVELLRTISAELDQEGIHWGDVLKVLFKPIALLTGMGNCSGCDVRQVVINSAQKLIEKLGKVDAAKAMKDLIKASFKQQPQEVLQQLKAILLV